MAGSWLGRPKHTTSAKGRPERGNLTGGMLPAHRGISVFRAAMERTADISGPERLNVPARGAAPPTLLCGVNFPSNTGFAWDYIEGIYARLADHLAVHGIRTVVAYPSMPSAPRSLAGSAAVPVRLDTALASSDSVLALARWARRENVNVVYLTDRSPVHWAYGILRQAGVRRVVVHDHASGAQKAPRGLKRAMKWAAARCPSFACDMVVAVSDFVVRRQVRVGLVPRERVVRIYNGVDVPNAPSAEARDALGSLVGARGDPRPIVACACRCTREKGVAHLLRAFDRAAFAMPSGCRPLLVYFGDGPFLSEIQALRERLRARDDIVLAGYRPDAAALVEGADLCVVPSIWDEAFGLAVAEPMARGKLVIASRVGGIPELIEDDVTGLLVPPGDEDALASAIERGLREPGMAAAIGRNARELVRRELSVDTTIRRLLPVLEAGFETRCGGVVAPAEAAS